LSRLQLAFRSLADDTLNATSISHPTLKSQHIQSLQTIRKCGRKYVGRQALVSLPHSTASSKYQAQAANTRNRREQDKDSTLYVGNLAEQATDAQVWELMLQAGPVVNVHLPKDRVTQTHQGYGFVEFASEEDADYAVKIMNQIRLWGKPIRVNKASADRRNGGPEGAGGLGGSAGVGAELFVGNLDAMVEEKMLFETFSRFGALVAPPKIARDEANLSKGYGFISYASFDASDDAIANMHGQFLMNKEITVQYAFKKDGKGERHGDQAERALAAQAKKNNVEVAIPAMPASLVMPGNAPTAPAAMNTGAGGRPPPSANTLQQLPSRRRFRAPALSTLWLSKWRRSSPSSQPAWRSRRIRPATYGPAWHAHARWNAAHASQTVQPIATARPLDSRTPSSAASECRRLWWTTFRTADAFPRRHARYASAWRSAWDGSAAAWIPAGHGLPTSPPAKVKDVSFGIA
jgi:RNA recognition motif-containing protein